MSEIATQERGGTGRGRKAGVPNKFTSDIKTACLEAFEAGGGAEWLQRQMRSEPRAFMALLGKILPSQIEATVNVETKQVLIDFTGLPPLAHATTKTLILEQQNDIDAEFDAILEGTEDD